MRRTTLAALAAALLVSGCGGERAGGDPVTTAPTVAGSEPTTTTEATTTTSEGTTTAPHGGWMTPEAQTMAVQISEAAQAGDFDRLAHLALEGGTTFTATFGEDYTEADDLAAYWRGQEAQGEPITETLLALLALPTHTTTAHDEAGDPVDIFVSPRVMSPDATEEDREVLAAALGEERVSGWWADGMYLGYRIGIDATGDWRFFVIGD